MKSLSYERVVFVRRSPEDVFAFCSDLRNELKWNPDAKSVEKLTAGPVDVGTRYRAQWSTTGAIVVEVAEFERPRMWESHSSAGGMQIDLLGTVTPETGGARYSVRVKVRPRGLARLYAPLALLAMRRREPENMRRIRAALESTARAPE